jgi:hypothetical protein
MKNFDNLRNYLYGIEFKDQLEVCLNEKYKPESRWDIIKDLCYGKKVIHMGCLDHVELIEKRIIDGEWLHYELSKITKKCIGIDINQSGIEYVKEKFGIENIVYSCIADSYCSEIDDFEWDYILLGEVLEHVGNPEMFLENIKARYKKVDKIIITVPHITNRVNYINARRRTEIINSDHKFWFTPYTLMKLIISAKIVLYEVKFANLISLNLIERLVYKFKSYFGITVHYYFYYYSSLIVIGKM